MLLIEEMKFVEYARLFTSNEIDQQKINSSFNAVNSFRIDAHAKSITEIEFQLVIDAIAVLENAFIAP